jgi:hypothetical protein
MKAALGKCHVTNVWTEIRALGIRSQNGWIIQLRNKKPSKLFLIQKKKVGMFAFKLEE